MKSGFGFEHGVSSKLHQKMMIPSGKRFHNYGKSPCLMGKSTISMAIFQFANCKRLPGRVAFHGAELGVAFQRNPWLFRGT